MAEFYLDFTAEQVNDALHTVEEHTEHIQRIENNIPNKTSALQNDSGFITNAVNDLANYYLKNQTYSRTEIDNKLSAIPKFSIEVVSSLPTSNISTTTVYLVSTGSETNNLYTEYIYVNNKWEYLGKQTVDLTGYVQKTELASYYTKTEMDSLLTTIRNSIPTKMSQLAEDSTHRTVTDTEKQTWNNKANKATTLAGYGITDGATKERVEQLSQEIEDLILVMTESELKELTQEELAEKYEKGTRIIVVKEDYENLVPLSISRNGGVYNGCGYMNGIRLNSSGETVESRQSCVTGFIPFTYGKKLSVYGSKGPLGTFGQYVATYDNAFAFIGVVYMESLSGITAIADENNIYTFTANTTQNIFTNASYIRVSLNPCEGRDVVVWLGGE